MQNNPTSQPISVDIDNVKILQKAIKSYVTKRQQQYDKVRGIHDIGEATPAQCNKMCELAEELEFLNRFLNI